jgi:hypothetical protein
MPPGSNARVAAEPFRSASTVSVPPSIASATQRRPAASSSRRQSGRQKVCVLPPRRGTNGEPHHRQMPASLMDVSRYVIL